MLFSGKSGQKENCKRKFCWIQAKSCLHSTPLRTKQSWLSEIRVSKASAAWWKRQPWWFYGNMCTANSIFCQFCVGWRLCTCGRQNWKESSIVVGKPLCCGVCFIKFRFFWSSIWNIFCFPFKVFWDEKLHRNETLLLENLRGGFSRAAASASLHSWIFGVGKCSTSSQIITNFRKVKHPQGSKDPGRAECAFSWTRLSLIQDLDSEKMRVSTKLWKISIFRNAMPGPTNNWARQCRLSTKKLYQA